MQLSTLALVTGFVINGLVLPAIRMKKAVNLKDEIETGKQRDAEQRERENALQKEIALTNSQRIDLEQRLGRILQEKQAAEKKFADLEAKFQQELELAKAKEVERIERENSMKNEIVQLKLEKKALEKSVKQVLQEKDAEEAKVLNLEAKLKEDSEQAKRNEERGNALQNQVNEAHFRIKELEKKLRLVLHEKDAQRKKAENFESKLIQVESNLRASQKEMSQLKLSAQKDKENVEELNRKLMKAISENQKKEDGIHKLQDELRLANLRASSLESQVALLNTSSMELQKKLAKSEANQIELEKKLNEAEKEICSFQSASQELEDEMHKKEFFELKLMKSSSRVQNLLAANSEDERKISKVPSLCQEQEEREKNAVSCAESTISKEFWFAEKIPSEREKQVVSGLRNLGNTCYMNTTIQCLAATECMLEYWTTEEYKGELNVHNALGWKGKVAEEFGKIVIDLWRGNRKIVDPTGLKAVICEFAPQFNGTRQHDSSELLAFLLDGIHEDLNRIIDKPRTDLVEHKGQDDTRVAEGSWEMHRKRNDSVIVDNFHGLLKCQLTCRTCKYASVRFEPFMFLSVPIPIQKGKKMKKKKQIELSDCLNEFTRQEILNQANGWLCHNCKELRCAEKKIEIWSVPKVIILHLKRFSYDSRADYYRKNGAFVDFPVESLDLSAWMLGPQKNANGSLMYDLYAVSNHMGEGIGSGHYTAYIKGAKDGKWYKADDSIITEIPDFNSIKSASAYVLFYRLRSSSFS